MKLKNATIFKAGSRPAPCDPAKVSDGHPPSEAEQFELKLRGPRRFDKGAH